MTREENLAGNVDQLTELGFPKTALYEYLDSCMGMPSIPYDYRKRIGDDLMDYHLTITQEKASGLYHPEGYQATLLQTHPIPHSIIAGIDTRELEQRLKAIDWNGYVPRKNEPGSDIFRAVVDLVNLGLWETKKALDISSRLELRYWLNTPVEQDLRIRSHIGDYQKSHYFPLNNEISDIHTTEAYNLLSGRAILKFYQAGDNAVFNSHWKQMIGDGLHTLPDYDFMSQLKDLPILEMQKDSSAIPLIHNLIRGDRCLVHLDKNNHAEKAYLELNPKDQSIRLISENLTELNPGHYKLNNVQKYIFEKKHKPGQSPGQKPNNKNKGRSL